jgi:23S rRNA pseudouridine1911/1915/1917 synthase
VHRLDKDTSGCIVVAKDDMSHLGLSGQFAARQVAKTYLGIVRGDIREDGGLIDGAIGRHPVKRKKMTVRHDTGRRAETRFEVLERFGDFTYLSLDLLTGRTHQIRVHMSHMGHPILGDEKYGRRKIGCVGDVGVKRQMLHAWKLAFNHPVTGEPMKFTAPLPPDMAAVLKELRKTGSVGKQ